MRFEDRILLSNSPISPAAAMSFAVTTTADSGAGSLRQAILNANGNPGTDTITFAIGTGAQTISPLSALPTITDPVMIDGTTQPGFEGQPLIELSGASAGADATGLVLTTHDSTIKGLVVNSFLGGGISINTPSATGNFVLGNYIGTDITGTIAEGNGAGAAGLLIYNGATGNTVGGPSVATRNIISGNIASGVRIFGVGTSGNVVEGNYIGTDVTGKFAIGNGASGLGIYDGATENTIGGLTSGARNIISGNASGGVNISEAGTSDNIIDGNYIGTDVTGSAAIANGNGGVQIYAGASANTVGGLNVGARNVISGNLGANVPISGAGTSGNVVQGNYIGVDVSGTVSIASSDSTVGVQIFGGASNDIIGGSVAGAGNLISGNSGPGIALSTVTQITISGNIIGLDATGKKALGNGFVSATSTAKNDGIMVVNSSNNIIGGLQSLARNIVGGNYGHGIAVTGSASFLNKIEGNYIGTDTSGTLPFGNGFDGVYLGVSGNSPSLIENAAYNNTIGGTEPGAGNVISGNVYAGVRIYGAEANANLVQGNLIGTNASGSAAIGNGTDGVFLDSSPASNQIGGSAAGARNVISGNLYAGVRIFGAGATLNVVQGNFIGTNANGTAAIGNIRSGIVVYGGATETTIGGTTAGAGNVVSGNGGQGIQITDLGTNGNILQGNFIGTDLTGKYAIGNAGDGVTVQAGASSNQIGGSTAGAGNVIAGNGDSGVNLVDNGTTGNIVQGNFIGTNSTGTVAIGNQVAGVFILGDASSNTIGYLAGDTSAPTSSSHKGNVIAFNGKGVIVADLNTIGNVIRGNSIYSNGLASSPTGSSFNPGIDLGTDGLTPNLYPQNATSTDPNGHQNVPNGTFIKNGTQTEIIGTVNSLPNQNITIDFYLDPSTSAPDVRQGKTYLGAQVVATDALGFARFDATFNVASTSAQGISATSTSLRGTSELAYLRTTSGSQTSDFDGNGFSDLAVFRPTTDQWITRYSVVGGSSIVQFGDPTAGDLPIPGNYDGTGTAELALFRPSTDQWIIRGVAGARIVQFGDPKAGDVPVPGDYDGTGKTELALFRPSTDQWIIRGPSGARIVQFGDPKAGDIPIPGDYDGTGKTEFALFRPSTDQWLILGPNGLRIVQFGDTAAGDIPVPGDYDGTGKTELALFRPSTDQWLIRSPSGLTITQFGDPNAGDIPIEAPYQLKLRISSRSIHAEAFSESNSSNIDTSRNSDEIHIAGSTSNHDSNRDLLDVAETPRRQRQASWMARIDRLVSDRLRGN